MASLGEREGRLDGDDAEFAIAQKSRDKAPFVANEVVRLAGEKDVRGVGFSTDGHVVGIWPVGDEWRGEARSRNLCSRWQLAHQSFGRIVTALALGIDAEGVLDGATS